MLRAIEMRLSRCKLKLRQQKTKIIYCKDAKRPGSYQHERFDFLGWHSWLFSRKKVYIPFCVLLIVRQSSCQGKKTVKTPFHDRNTGL